MQNRAMDFLTAVMILAGVIILYLFAGSSAWQTDVAKVLLLIGLLIFVLRIHRVVRAFLNPPKGEDSKQGEIEMRLLIQTMGVIARADGKIDDNEIETICEIHARMFGINLQKEEVNEILTELGSPIEILGSLGRNKSKISPLMKQKIIQACHLVTISDLEIDDKESAQVGAIGLALGFSKVEIKEMIALAEI